VRSYILLILLLIGAAFGAGYYGFSFRGDYQASPKDKVDISYLKRKFVKENQSINRISTRSLFPTQDFKTLAFSKTSNEITNRDVFFKSNNCFEEITKIQANVSVHKVLYWERYRCGLEKELPGSFFQFPPFAHPSGYSFVYLFYKLKGEDKVDKSWILNHIEYLTYEELKIFKKKWKSLPEPYSQLADLDPDTRVLIGSLTGTFFSGDNVYLLDWDIFNFFETIYKVYKKDDFINHFKDSSYNVSKLSKKKCLIKEGNLCWNYSLAHMIEKVGYSKLTISLILIGFIISTLFAIYSLFSKEKKEDEKRKFALRILSHELRTPVASILLKIENLLNNFDHFTDDDQERILKISSDAHRLRRLIEMSTNYLTTSQKKNNHGKELESLNEFFETLNLDYPGVKFQMLEKDIKLNCDEYWLQVCLKNLIENALSHGKDPIEVQCQVSERSVKISVIDSGECIFESLKQMTEDFVKGSKSSGTGLGLNIVQTTLKSLNGKLEFSKNPTTFTINLTRSGHEPKTITN